MNDLIREAARRNPGRQLELRHEHQEGGDDQDQADDQPAATLAQQFGELVQRQLDHGRLE